MAEKFVAGQTQENAVFLLEAAEKKNIHPREVRTVDGGYMVPEEIADAAEKKSKRSAKSEDEEPVQTGSKEAAKKTEAKKSSDDKDAKE